MVSYLPQCPPWVHSIAKISPSSSSTKLSKIDLDRKSVHPLVWKLSQGRVSGYSLPFQNNAGRGTYVLVPPFATNSPSSVKKAREASLQVKGARLFNLMPFHLRCSRLPLTPGWLVFLTNQQLMEDSELPSPIHFLTKWTATDLTHSLAELIYYPWPFLCLSMKLRICV